MFAVDEYIGNSPFQCFSFVGAPTAFVRDIFRAYCPRDIHVDNYDVRIISFPDEAAVFDAEHGGYLL